MTKKKPKSRLTKVQTRLFTEDIDEIKRQADEAGEANWSSRLRHVVHEALKVRRIVR